MDESIIGTDTAYAYKRQRQNARENKSYRPLGLEHPLASLPADMPKLRHRAALIELAGPSQMAARVTLVWRPSRGRKPLTIGDAWASRRPSSHGGARASVTMEGATGDECKGLPRRTLMTRAR